MRSRRVALVLAAVAAGAMACASCSAILGIEQLPRRSDASAAPDGDSDGGLDCEAGSHTCACEKHDFCDDFDNPSEPLFFRWRGPDGIDNPFILAEAGISVTDASTSSPNAIHVAAFETNQPAYALAMHRPARPPGRAFAGIRFAMMLRIETLSLTERRGPVPDAATALVSAIARGVPPVIPGVALVVGDTGAYLVAANNLLQSKPTDASAPAAVLNLFDENSPVLSLLQNWVRAEILIATIEVAKKEGFTKCDGKADAGAPVVAASIGPKGAYEQCTALPAAFDGGLEWASDPTIAAGGALYGGGDMSIRQDDVTVDFLEP